MSGWHYQYDGTARGPLTDDQVKALCDANVIHAGTPVWKPGLADWQSIVETDYPYKSSLMPPPMRLVANVPARNNSRAPQANVTPVVENLSLWGYFARTMTSNYAQFYGRARRREYWGYTLFMTVAVLVVIVAGLTIDGIAGNLDQTQGKKGAPVVMGIALLLFVLGSIIPNLAVTIRRLHDVGVTGWLALLMIVPYVGGLIILIFMCLPTEPVENKHGPSPKSV